MKKIKATLTEQGNGFPSNGNLVYDGGTDTAYRVIGSNGRISTHSAGRGNSIEADLEEVGSAGDLSEDEWDEIHPCGVDVAEDEEDVRLDNLFQEAAEDGRIAALYEASEKEPLEPLENLLTEEAAQ